MMSDYISRESVYPLAKKICDEIDNTPRVLLGRTILDFIDDIPAANVAPVVRGEWIRTSHKDCFGFKCSICGAVYNKRKRRLNFCPNCGAWMGES